MIFKQHGKNLLIPVLLVLLTLPVMTTATTVQFKTTLGNFYVELFDNDAPVTVANFLKYVDDGDYNNSIVHRSVPDFVIQGGGYNYINATFDMIPTDPPIQSEVKISNTRGTIAMARLSGDPDSATSQWFINLADNTTLDTNDGGFTVFGRVTGNGMSVVDAIAALERWNFSSVLGSAFGELPLINYPNDRPDDPTPRLEELVMVDISVAVDTDGDGVFDDVDNCPAVANPDQSNHDDDALGDACDEDDDNDGVPDATDAFPLDASESVDTDGDGTGNNADSDDDNDGLSDDQEIALGTDPLNPDTDGDGVSDGQEVANNRNPKVNESKIIIILNAGSDE